MRMERIPGGDAQTRLGRALAGHAAAAGCTLTVLAAQTHPWASATYVGEQQDLVVSIAPAAAARRWLAELPDVDLPMRGHVAMPPAVERIEEEDGALRVTMTVLTLVDG